MQELIKLIQERRSSRITYDLERTITNEDLKQILEAARWTPTAHNMQNYEIVVVDDKKLLKDIGDIKFPVSETFIKENYQQMSFSEEELMRKKVGVLGTMFPPFMRNPDFKIEDAKEIENPFMKELVKTSTVLLIVLYDPGKRAPASEGDFLGILSLGCLMENIWLMANSLGISLHILSTLNSEGVEIEVKKILNIPEELKIAFSCRLGYPKTEPGKYLRVRRDIDDFTHHNIYGNKGIK
jgi:nitroreductase